MDQGTRKKIEQIARWINNKRLLNQNKEKEIEVSDVDNIGWVKEAIDKKEKKYSQTDKKR